MKDLQLASWLPDSRRLLVQTNEGELLVVDRESGSAKPAGSTGRPAFNLTLARDGRRLYGNRQRLDSDIWMLDFGQAPSR